MVVVSKLHGWWSLKVAYIWSFKGVIVVTSIVCVRKFTRVGKKCDLSGAAFMFSFKINWWYFL